MRLAQPLSKGGTQNKELERQPWGQGLATLSEDLSSVSSTPHPPWLQLCPLLVSMGTALTCKITHIHRSMHINEKMIKTNYYYSTFYWVIMSPHKITIQGETNTLSCIQCWLDTRHTMAGQSGQAKVGRLPEASWEGLGYCHLWSATPFRVQAPSTQLPNSTPLTDCLVLYLEGDTTQNVLWNIQLATKNKILRLPDVSLCKRMGVRGWKGGEERMYS